MKLYMRGYLAQFLHTQKPRWLLNSSFWHRRQQFPVKSCLHVTFQTDECFSPPLLKTFHLTSSRRRAMRGHLLDPIKTSAADLKRIRQKKGRRPLRKNGEDAKRSESQDHRGQCGEVNLGKPATAVRNHQICHSSHFNSQQESDLRRTEGTA